MKYLIEYGGEIVGLRLNSGKLTIGGRKAGMELIEYLLDELGIGNERRLWTVDPSTYRCRCEVKKGVEKTKVVRTLYGLEKIGFVFAETTGFGRLMR